MAAERFIHYLPLRRFASRASRRIPCFTKPLFPGYVFVCVPQARKNRIYQHNLLVHALTINDAPNFLRQIADVKRVLAADFELHLRPLPEKGRRVKIIGGALTGIHGYVDDSSDPHGVVIAVDFLQTGLVVKVPANCLQSCDQ